MRGLAKQAGAGREAGPGDPAKVGLAVLAGSLGSKWLYRLCCA
jgi:hypothetical protein